MHSYCKQLVILTDCFCARPGPVSVCFISSVPHVLQSHGRTGSLGSLKALGALITLGVRRCAADEDANGGL